MLNSSNLYQNVYAFSGNDMKENDEEFDEEDFEDDDGTIPRGYVA